MKPRDLTKLQLYNFKNTKDLSPTAGKFFEEIIKKIVKKSSNEIIILSENILSTSALIEMVIKNTLIDINPALILKDIDVDTIAFCNKKTKRLKEKKEPNIGAHIAPITELIRRFFLFKQNIDNGEGGLLSFFKIRNSIAHPLKFEKIDYISANLHLTKYAIPFLENYIKLNDELRGKFKKVQMVIHNAYQTELVKYILEFRSRAESFNLKEIEDLILKEIKLEDNDETVFAEDIICPACSHQSTYIIQGVDFDYNPDGVIVNSYIYTNCKVCGIEFNETQFKEIIEHSVYYFKENLNMGEWKIAYDSLYDPDNKWQYI